MAPTPALSAPALARILTAPRTIVLGAGSGGDAIGFFDVGVSDVGVDFATRRLTAKYARRGLKGCTMPYAGDYLPYSSPGEVQPYSIDFANQLGGDAIATVTSALTVASNKPFSFYGSDADPSANLVGPPSFSGTACTQVVGPCLPNVAYALSFTVTTMGGRILLNYGHIYCQAIQ